MRDTADRLLVNAQQAGVLRDDITSQDVLRLVHGIAMATEHAPEDTDRLLSLLLDGLRRKLDGRGAVLVRGAEHDGGAR
jgi:hypothetical protein